MGIIGVNWFVALTLPQSERSAVSGLIGRRFTAYGPTVFKQQRTGRRDKDNRDIMREVEKPMFPGYIFVQFERGLENFNGVCAVPGVRDFMRGANRDVVTMPAHEMARILETEAVEAADFRACMARVQAKRETGRKRWRPLPSLMAEISGMDDAARNAKLLTMIGMGKAAEAA